MIWLLNKISKISPSIAQALANVSDGSTVLIGGFRAAGILNELIEGLIEQGARELTVVNNNAGNGDIGLPACAKPTIYVQKPNVSNGSSSDGQVEFLLACNSMPFNRRVQ